MASCDFIRGGNRLCHPPCEAGQRCVNHLLLPTPTSPPEREKDIDRAGCSGRPISCFEYTFCISLVVMGFVLRSYYGQLLTGHSGHLHQTQFQRETKSFNKKYHLTIKDSVEVGSKCVAKQMILLMTRHPLKWRVGGDWARGEGRGGAVGLWGGVGRN